MGVGAGQHLEENQDLEEVSIIEHWNRRQNTERKGGPCHAVGPGRGEVAAYSTLPPLLRSLTTSNRWHSPRQLAGDSSLNVSAGPSPRAKDGKEQNKVKAH